MNARTRSDRKRAAILAAAAEAIARDGYHGMSMRDLSRATGTGLASFYVHFASKEDILFALQTEAFDALIDSAQKEIAREQDPERRLYGFIVNHVRFFTAHPDLMRALVQEAGALPAPRRAAVRERKERYFEMARGLLEVIVEFGCGGVGERAPAEHDEAELERATYALFGMLNWIYGWYEPGRHGSPESLARTFERIALCGVLGRLPARNVEFGTADAAVAGGVT
jgi:AcrR family transcriptional regulator